MTLVLDTNICVDLANGTLLELVLKLPYRFVLPDVIIAELKEPEGNSLITLGYEPFPLPAETVQIVFQLSERYAKPSRNDLFALATAQLLKTTLLTGDEYLRKAGEKENVAVHGLLWLLDRLFESKIVSGSQLCESLDMIVKKGARLPNHDIQRLKERWK